MMSVSSGRARSSRKRGAMVRLVQEETLDDALNELFTALRSQGDITHPTQGEARELVGVGVELLHPRARVSRSQTRGRMFSALGEFLWYLSGSDDLEMIRYYITSYDKYAFEGRIEGAYGPRLFGKLSRLEDVIELLQRRKDTRRAVVQIFEHSDLENRVDVPCTTSMQFLLREDRLDLVVTMRSNDAFLGLPHDVFAFTMIQEIVARRLGAKLGRYVHFVGSMHAYERDRDDISKFLDHDAWQTPREMPAMPAESIKDALVQLLDAEKKIRTHGSAVALGTKIESDAYWGDIVRLLRAFATDDAEEIAQIRSALNDPFYALYLQDREELKRDA
jgi:thymidylate synthase